MLLHIKESFDSYSIYDLSEKELKEKIKEMLPKIKFKQVDLDKNFVNGNGKELYYTLHDVMWDAVGSHGGSSIYTNTSYPIQFDGIKAIYRYGSRGTQDFIFLDSGYKWSITKGGNVKMDRATMKIDALRFIYANIEDCLNNKS